MLSKDELKELAKSSGLKLHQQEKDYLQTITLYHMYQKVAKELVFKGGTALEKVHGLNRFSEDLDFTRNAEIDLDSLLERMLIGLRNYGIDCELKKEKPGFEFSDRYKISAKGPLYSGEISRVFIRIEISKREQTLTEPEVRNIFPVYRDVPNFSLTVMPLMEMTAEKVRAVFTRDKPRDVYDLWFLLNKGVEVDYNMVEKKLSYYDLHYSYSLFSEKIEESGKSWENELSVLLPSIPEFSKVKQFILERFRQGNV